MSVRGHGSALLLSAVALSAVAVAADPLSDARRGASGWVSYSVPLAGTQGPCCYDSWRRGEPKQRVCSLEGAGHDGMFGTIGGRERPPQTTDLHMYLRLERGEVRQLLAVGGDCPVDAGDAPVRVLDGVTPAASAALLLGLVESRRGDLADEALQALALHDRVGTDALLALARDAKRAPAARRQALFWLGQSEDPRALAEIESILTR